MSKDLNIMIEQLLKAFKGQANEKLDLLFDYLGIEIADTPRIVKRSDDDEISGAETPEKLSKEKNIDVICSCVNSNLIKQNIKTKYQLFNIEYDIKNIGNVV